MNPARAYSQTQAVTASHDRLMVMLFEAALKNMRAGAAALDDDRPTEAVSMLIRASEIVLELAATLDRARAPDLCDRLGKLYEFVALRLSHAALARDSRAAREAERAFAPVAEAFASVVAPAAEAAYGARP
jgi:flagellar protein FliS